MQQQQTKRPRGRPKGSKTKNRRSSPRRNRPQLHQAASVSSAAPIAAAPAPESSTATSPTSSVATAAPPTIEERSEHFDTVAATVPDVIGAPAPDADSFPAGVVPPEAAGGGDELQGEVVLDHATVRFYLKFGFETAARMLKEKRWELSPEELSAATPATHAVVQKWLPWFLGTTPYKEEIAFAIVMAGIVIPRLPLLKKPTSTAGPGTSASSASPATEKAI